jgi:hypothetical protein
MIQVESFLAISEELLPLIRNHWLEVAHHTDKIPLDPQWKMYFDAERDGRLVTITARNNGKLVGYSIFFLRAHIHYAGCLIASNDVIYLTPELRKGTRLGTQLIDESEKLIAAIATLRGMTCRITWHIKPDHDWSAILKRKGYIVEEVILGKLVEVGHGL